jgi:hypothetical protein
MKRPASQQDVRESMMVERSHAYFIFRRSRGSYHDTETDYPNRGFSLSYPDLPSKFWDSTSGQAGPCGFLPFSFIMRHHPIIRRRMVSPINSVVKINKNLRVSATNEHKKEWCTISQRRHLGNVGISPLDSSPTPVAPKPFGWKVDLRDTSNIVPPSLSAFTSFR